MIPNISQISPIIKIKAFDNFQTASVLSTSNDLSPTPNGLINPSSDLYKILPDFLKKKRGQPTCIQCIADDCTMIFDKIEEYEKHIKTHSNLIKCEYPGCQK